MSLVLPKNAMLQCYNPSYLIFRSIICQVLAYERLETKENFGLLTLKLVAVAF